jgi:hypothetical protein
MADRDPNDTRRHRLEGVIPELLKRAVEIGVEKAVEAPDNLKHYINDLKLPKEIAGFLLSQVEETKNGLYRVVAKEMRGFLENTNLAGELQKAFTALQFEVNTTIRFRPNDGKDTKTDDSEAEGKAGMPKPEIKTEVYVKRDERPRRRRGE